MGKVDITVIVRKLQSGNEYANLCDSFDALVHNYDETLKYGLDRSELARLQAESVKRLEGIDPSLHVQYHEVSKMAKSSLRNYYSCIKTFLNALIIVITNNLPDHISRGLPKNSVSKFIKKLSEKIDSLDASMEKKSLIKVLEEVKVLYDFAEYRNKEIEHPQDTYGKVGGIAFSGVVPKFIKQVIDDEPEDIVAESKRKVIKVKRKEPHINAILYGNSEDSYKDVIVHAIPYEMKEGEIIEKGEPMFQIDETWKEHYREYGVHFHLFPDIERPDETTKLPTGKEVRFSSSSPDVVESMNEIAQSIYMIYKSLRKIKK